MRKITNSTERERCFDDFRVWLDEKIKEKGPGCFVSTHEISGVLTEEYDEFKEAVHTNDEHKTIMELFDIMVAAYWGILSIRCGGTEW